MVFKFMIDIFYFILLGCLNRLFVYYNFGIDCVIMRYGLSIGTVLIVIRSKEVDVNL